MSTMTANTILDRAFPIEPVIATAIRDAALGQHEQEAMRRRCNITIRPMRYPTVNAAIGVYQDGILLWRFGKWNEARAFAYDLAAQLVRDGLVTL